MLENYSDVLKIDDIMNILYIGRNTAYKLIDTGAIKSLRIGRNIRIPKIYLIDYLTNTGYTKESNMICAPMSQKKGA